MHLASHPHVTSFRSLMDGETMPFTLRLRDPLGNSFIGSAEHENPVDDPMIEVSKPPFARNVRVDTLRWLEALRGPCPCPLTALLSVAHEGHG